MDCLSHSHSLRLSFYSRTVLRKAYSSSNSDESLMNFRPSGCVEVKFDLIYLKAGAIPHQSESFTFMVSNPHHFV